MIYRHVVVFFLVFLLWGGPVRAEESTAPLPDKFHGAWSFRSCDKIKTVMVYSGHFVMEAGKNGIFMDRILRTEQREHGAARLWRKRAYYDLTPGWDARGRIFVMTYPFLPPEINVVHLVFRRCDRSMEGELGLDRDLLALPAALDHIDIACDGEKGLREASCGRAVFDAFDGNADEGLDTAELSRAFARAYLLARSGPCNLTQALLKYSDSAEDETKFAAAVLRIADQNGDGRVGLDEIGADWTLLAADPDFRTFTEIVRYINPLFPFLPPPPEGTVLKDIPLPSGR